MNIRISGQSQNIKKGRLALWIRLKKKKIIKIIDDNKEKLIAFARDIYTHAELGYKEFRTALKIC